MREHFIRPVAVIGLTFTLTLVAASSFSVTTAMCLAVIFLVLSLFLSCVKTIRSPKPALVALVISLALGCFSLYTQFNYLPAVELDGKTCYVSAVVPDIFRSKSGTYGVTVKLDPAFTNTLVPAKANIYFPAADESYEQIRVADRIETTLTFKKPEDYGTYSSVDSFKAEGIYLLSFHRGSDIKVITDDSFHISRVFYEIREAIKENNSSRFNGKEAGVLNAMTVSDKSDLDPGIYNDFIRTGTVHILVVSGLHLVIFSQFIIKTLKFCHVKRKVRYVFGIFAVLLFMGVTGFLPAVNRAGFTLILMYAGNLFERESDSLTSLGLAALLFSLFMPFVVLGISFQLTYLSTLGILLFTGKMSARVNAFFHIQSDFVKWVVNMVCLTVSVMVTTLPLTVYYFKGIPVLAPIFNLPIALISQLILSLSLVMQCVSPFPFLSVFPDVLTSMISLATKAILGLTRFCSSLSFSYLEVSSRFVYFWIVATIILLGFVYAKCNFRYKYLFTLTLSTAVLFLAVLTNTIVNANTLTISSCTLSDSTAVLLHCDGKSFALGCNKLLCQTAGQSGRRDFAFVLADNKDLLPVQELGKYAKLDIVYSNFPVVSQSISCNQLLPVASSEIVTPTPLKLNIYHENEQTTCVMEYGKVNLIYGKYHADFEKYWKPGRVNIYILVNDCKTSFQKPVNYAIMLNGFSSSTKEKNPKVEMIDASDQGFSSFFVNENGQCKKKGGDQNWLT